MEMLFKLARKNSSSKVQKVVKELDVLGLEEISGTVFKNMLTVPKKNNTNITILSLQTPY